MNTYLELAYAIKQTGRDIMANTEGPYDIFTVILCMVHLLFVIFRRNCVLILVVTIFQFFKACYSVPKYTCVNKHTIFDNETEK